MEATCIKILCFYYIKINIPSDCHLHIQRMNTMEKLTPRFKISLWSGSSVKNACLAGIRS
jgi:hypothetical protein